MMRGREDRGRSFWSSDRPTRDSAPLLTLHTAYTTNLIYITICIPVTQWNIVQPERIGLPVLVHHSYLTLHTPYTTSVIYTTRILQYVYQYILVYIYIYTNILLQHNTRVSHCTPPRLAAYTTSIVTYIPLVNYHTIQVSYVWMPIPQHISWYQQHRAHML